MIFQGKTKIGLDYSISNTVYDLRMLTVLFVLIWAYFFAMGCRFHKTLPPDGSYLSRERTSMINGFFILMVFCSHLMQCDYKTTGYDLFLYNRIVHPFGQLVVSTFLFFSGYGIMTQIQLKGETYLRKLPLRFIKLLVHFEIAVMLYLCLQYALGMHYGMWHLAKIVVGWKTAGNPSWYVVITLWLYAVLWVFFRLCSCKRPAMVALLMAASCIPVIWLLCQRRWWWVDTFMAFPAGMLFCLYRAKAEAAVRALRVPAWFTGLVLSAVAVYWYGADKAIAQPFLHMLANNGASILFGVGIAFLFSCMTLKRKPSLLIWMGGAGLFNIYIFHLLPKVYFVHEGISVQYPLLYGGGCIVCTVLLAVGAQYLFRRVDTGLERCPLLKSFKG